MAISFVAASNAHNFYSSGTLTITKPTGTVNDDLMIAVIGGTPSTLTGWTQIGTGASGTSLATVRAYWKKAASEGASYAWSITSSTDAWGVIVSYRGCDPTTPVDTTNTTTGAHTGTAFTPSSVTTTAQQLLVGWAMEYKFDGSGSASTTWTVTGATSRSTASDVQGGSPNNEETSYVICDKTPGAGSNTQTLTASQSSDGGVSGIILLNPAGTSASAGVATITAAAYGPTVTVVPGIGAGSAPATAAGQSPRAGIGALAGVATATAAAVGAVRGKVAGIALATATAYNASVLIGLQARPTTAAVTATGRMPLYVGIGIFPSRATASATAFNPNVLLPGGGSPTRIYYVPVETRTFVADPSDVRVITVMPSDN